MTTRKERREARKAAKRRDFANEQIQQAVAAHQRKEANAIATKQFIALKDSPHSQRCPVTGKKVDIKRLPAVISGPYFSVPYGIIGKRKRSKWSISPVSTNIKGRINPCVSVMWARVEVPA